MLYTLMRFVCSFIGMTINFLNNLAGFPLRVTVWPSAEARKGQKSKHLCSNNFPLILLYSFAWVGFWTQVCFGTRQAAHRPHSDFTVPSGANQTGHQSGSGTLRAQRRKMARMALVRPLLPTSLLIVLHSQACLLSQSDGNRETIRHQVCFFFFYQSI